MQVACLSHCVDFNDVGERAHQRHRQRYQVPRIDAFSDFCEDGTARLREDELPIHVRASGNRRIGWAGNGSKFSMGLISFHDRACSSPPTKSNTMSTGSNCSMLIVR